ncbi:MAG TPA: uroporphyrinogen-III C-methyltransferase [Candidatus Avacidaminococcus intestinavium]|uniref:uroporphyrinogen-III C-methyltransferase n=1 Tax=Candidatus Avacidaminococcus intestinavium TaxID=2840684 RepID=A0A9D1MNC5_9FIRM|nr:uroporphyrinogen-III C-methyltransferase [Candidatus Avacidaminococcus intestinavium]
MKQGFVSLVGAGPGDYKLITIKGLEAIQSADVIVYDYLADRKLLAAAREDAEIIYVGKKSKEHTMKQEDICKLLVEKAKAGNRVCRLKGGDPFVFGRGGEEAVALKEAQIMFEIVPGITSAISVPAYAGIPVTQRNMAVSFAVITGHENPNKEKSGVNWEKLATAVDTLVFLMGIENLKVITEKLIANGRATNTPAAVIRWGTKAEQRTIVTTLECAVSDVEKNKIKPPAIFIVGEVVRMREQLSWFETKPLFGKRIIVTRAQAQASKLTQALEKQGAVCLEAPSIKISPLEDTSLLKTVIAKLPEYTWLVLTSVNAVKIFFDALASANLDARALAGIKIAAVGTATGDALGLRGIKADCMPKHFTAEGLIEELTGKIHKTDKVLLPQALQARKLLAQWLDTTGAKVDVVPLYDTIIDATAFDNATIKEALLHKECDLITFASASAVKNFLKLIGEELLPQVRDVKIACIGPITAEACRKAGLTPIIMPEVATIPALVSAIEKYFSEEVK